MMLGTKARYDELVQSDEGAASAPSWKLIDDIGASRVSTVVWGIVYTLFYVAFADHWWMYAFLPVHFLMGPIHGAIVNWCGHLYGYRNFELETSLEILLVFDFITLGELFQNNHHKFRLGRTLRRGGLSDPTYTVMVVMNFLGIIKMPRRGPSFLAPVPECRLSRGRQPRVRANHDHVNVTDVAFHKSCDAVAEVEIPHLDEAVVKTKLSYLRKCFEERLPPFAQGGCVVVADIFQVKKLQVRSNPCSIAEGGYRGDATSRKNIAFDKVDGIPG